eukprot:TRINITY_DN1765_c0_g1_i1.p1 TRINITY_DN1765_c0_g1~~TRINITY_DN1765_c0_g1_i1.p1  ORF type:complete len:203 (+),score=59.50 TRINITY_DN1765_c0_g1_i1:29-610(+)
MAEYINEKKKPLKIILVGDSAVGKTRMLERYLMDKFKAEHDSTYALDLYPFNYEIDEFESIPVTFWDAAGQTQFNNFHSSYYFGCECCLLCFDAVRKMTYKDLRQWYQELVEYVDAHSVPVVVVCNKIDLAPDAPTKNFKFAEQNGFPIFFVSAADGTNIVDMFNTCIEKAIEFRRNGSSDVHHIIDILEKDR